MDAISIRPSSASNVHGVYLRACVRWGMRTNQTTDFMRRKSKSGVVELEINFSLRWQVRSQYPGIVEDTVFFLSA